MLECQDNILKTLPTLPDELISLHVRNNPIDFLITTQIEHNNERIELTNDRIEKWDRFRRTYFILRCKNKLREYLWQKVLGPKIEEKYHPKNLELLLQDKNEDDAFDDELLEHW